MTMMILPMIKNLGRSSWSFWVNNKDDDIILKHLNTMAISMNITTTKKNIWWCLYLETQRNSPSFPIVFIIIVLIARFWDGFNIHTHTHTHKKNTKDPGSDSMSFFLYFFFHSLHTIYKVTTFVVCFVKKNPIHGRFYDG